MKSQSAAAEIPAQARLEELAVLNPLVIGGAILLVGVVLAGLLIWGAIGSFRTASMIADTPQSQAGEVLPGFRKVRGKAVAVDGVLVSPFSQSPCMYYEYNGYFGLKGISIRITIGNARPSPKVRGIMFQGKKAILWAVEDETGRVEVNPKDCEATIVHSVFKSSWPATNRPDHVNAFIADTLESPEMTNRGEIQCQEYTIRPGAEVIVIGDVVETEAGLQFASQNTTLLIGDEQETAFHQRYLRWAYIQLGISVLFLAGFGYMGGSQFQPDVGPPQPPQAKDKGGKR